MDIWMPGGELPSWIAYPVMVLGGILIAAAVGFRIYYRLKPPPRRRPTI
jgi:hypothetical protein